MEVKCVSLLAVTRAHEGNRRRVPADLGAGCLCRGRSEPLCLPVRRAWPSTGSRRRGAERTADQGPGSFQIAFLDELAKLHPGSLEGYAAVREGNVRAGGTR